MYKNVNFLMYRDSIRILFQQNDFYIFVDDEHHVMWLDSIRDGHRIRHAHKYITHDLNSALLVLKNTMENIIQKELEHIMVIHNS